MHRNIELWQALVGVVAGALPVTFVLYWVVDSVKRVPTVWREFWGKLAHRTTTN